MRLLKSPVNIGLILVMATCMLTQSASGEGAISSGGENPVEFAKEVYRSNADVVIESDRFRANGWSELVHASGAAWPLDAIILGQECLDQSPLPVGYSFPCAFDILVTQHWQKKNGAVRKLRTLNAVVHIGFSGVGELKIVKVPGK